MNIVVCRTGNIKYRFSETGELLTNDKIYYGYHEDKYTAYRVMMKALYQEELYLKTRLQQIKDIQKRAVEQL